MNRDNFVLPTLGPLLDQCAREVHYGDGIAIIRGLDPKRYSVEDSSIMYLGISRYIGEQFGIQSSKGAMICKLPIRTSFASLGVYQSDICQTNSTCSRLKIVDHPEGEAARYSHK